MLSPGVILQQRYRITRLLARGGMGAVYEAEAVHLRNATVAVKETFFGEDRQSLREQFEREAATLARLRHSALPQVKDHFIEGGGQFLVMDFIEGDDLDTLLERRLNEIGSPFGFRQVMEWAERLLDALSYIHGQYPPVIHRDIKPQNLKLTPRAELFLIDFGLAKDATTPTSPGNSLHAYTLEFAPPEQIKGEGTDARSDIYSLGATLYYLATGKLPPDARVREEAVVKHLMPDLLRPAHQVNTRIPFGFSAALAKAMALDLTSNKGFKLHFTPRESGYLYLLSPEEEAGNLAPRLFAQAVRAGADIGYPDGWLDPDPKAKQVRITVIFSSERMALLDFLSEAARDKRPLNDDEQRFFQNFRNLAAPSEPRQDNSLGDNPAVVVLTIKNGQPLVFEIVSSGKLPDG